MKRECCSCIEERQQGINKDKVEIRIEGCEIKMNQNHGVKVKEVFERGKEGEVRVERCLIEDNFCDGIHISNPFLQHRRLKSLLPQQQPPLVHLHNNRILSNKNNGFSLLT
jgi:tmRNA-binding protein